MASIDLRFTVPQVGHRTCRVQHNNFVLLNLGIESVDLSDSHLVQSTEPQRFDTYITNVPHNNFVEPYMFNALVTE